MTDIKHIDLTGKERYLAVTPQGGSFITDELSSDLIKASHERDIILFQITEDKVLFHLETNDGQSLWGAVPTPAEYEEINKYNIEEDEMFDPEDDREGEFDDCEDCDSCEPAPKPGHCIRCEEPIDTEITFSCMGCDTDITPTDGWDHYEYDKTTNKLYKITINSLDPSDPSKDLYACTECGKSDFYLSDSADLCSYCEHMSDND